MHEPFLVHTSDARDCEPGLPFSYRFDFPASNAAATVETRLIFDHLLCLSHQHIGKVLSLVIFLREFRAHRMTKCLPWPQRVETA